MTQGRLRFSATAAARAVARHITFDNPERNRITVAKRKPKRQAKSRRAPAKPARRRPSAKRQSRQSKAHGLRDKGSGQFLPGNRFWEARSSAGQKPLFANGEALWKVCVEYFTWVEANPLWEDHLVTFQGMATHEPVAKMRAMTLAGLCHFLDIDQRTWALWRASRADLIPVITRAEAVIYEQKFSGAAADLLNANIISRDLGLADKSELTGKDGGPIETVDHSEVSDNERARRIAMILARGRKSNGNGAEVGN